MKTPLRIKAALAITFALCFLTALVFADNKRMKFGSGGDPAQCMIDTNMFLCFASGSGAAASNAAVRTTVWTDMTAKEIPASNGTAATITQITIPANALENTGDSIKFTAAGTMPTGVANTNDFVFVYGSTTIFDSGLMPSNTSYRAELSLTRSSTNQLLAQASLYWGPALATLPAQALYTNTTVFIGETNTVDTVLKFQGTSRRQGSSTNLFNQLEFQPTGK